MLFVVTDVVNWATVPLVTFQAPRILSKSEIVGEPPSLVLQVCHLHF